jgi:Spy/CpxP family protein refolding chaperone
MKNILTRLFCTSAIFVGGSIIAAGQDLPQGPPVGPPDQKTQKERPGMKRMQQPNLLRELNLSPEQITQIRKMHTEKRPALADAMRKFNEANRTLDEAIYADSYDQGRVDSLLKAREVAQSEFFRIKTEIEIAIRKLLTPDQLTKFRDLRFRNQRGDDFLRDRPPGSPRDRKEKPRVF